MSKVRSTSAGAGLSARVEPQESKTTKKVDGAAKAGVGKVGAGAGLKAKAPVKTEPAEKKPADAATVRGSRLRALAQGAHVKNALSTSMDGPDGGGSVSERKRVETEARVEQERRLEEGKWPAETRPGPGPKTDPSDPDARVPPAPTETTTERAKRIGAEVLDPSTLKPGESVKVKIGGSASAGGGIGLKAEGADELEIKANKDGTYTITADGSTAKGVIGQLGAKVKGAGLNVGGEGTYNTSQKVEIKAANAQEAKEIARALAKQAAFERLKSTLPAGQLLPSPLSSHEQSLIEKRVTATETTWGVGGGFEGTAGAADSTSPVNVGGKGENKGTDTVTTRTEFEVDQDTGENYPARIKEIRKQEAHLQGTVGLNGESGEVTVGTDQKIADHKRTQTHELIHTRHLPKPGSNEPERSTLTLRETNVDEVRSGRNARSTKVVKEQELDASKIDKDKLTKIWVDTRPEVRNGNMRELPATKTKVTIEESETASTQGVGPYNANRKTRTETFEIDPAKQGEIFTQRDADPERLRQLKDPNAEVTTSESELDIEGAGTGGKIEIGVMGTGVGIEADIQKTREIPQG